MSTWNADEIRYMQEQFGQTGKTVENITNKIFEHVQRNPESHTLTLQNSYDEDVVKRLESLGYTVEKVFGGVYKDQIWTQVSW